MYAASPQRGSSTLTTNSIYVSARESVNGLDSSIPGLEASVTSGVIGASGASSSGGSARSGVVAELTSSLLASIELSAGAGPRGGAAILAGVTWRERKERRRKESIMTASTTTTITKTTA